MKTKQELSDILDFVAEYASYLLGSGVHTSRVIRNAQRIGTSQGVDIQLSSFQKSIIITVHDERSGEVVTRVVKIPALPISFERNSDLSALSWDAVDEHLSLTDLPKLEIITAHNYSCYHVKTLELSSGDRRAA